MSRGLKAPFKPYEGQKSKDKHVRITNSMLTHKKYIELTYSAQVLYIYMKAWSCGNQEFEYSWSLAKKIIKSNRTYISSKNELIEAGFIECIRTCKCSKFPNKYRFVNSWYM